MIGTIKNYSNNIKNYIALNKKEQLNTWLISNKDFIKLNNIEKAIGIPYNTLNKFISTNSKVQRDLPSKWIEPLEDFITKNLNYKA